MQESNAGAADGGSCAGEQRRRGTIEPCVIRLTEVETEAFHDAVEKRQARAGGTADEARRWVRDHVIGIGLVRVGQELYT